MSPALELKNTWTSLLGFALTVLLLVISAAQAYAVLEAKVCRLEQLEAERKASRKELADDVATLKTGVAVLTRDSEYIREAVTDIKQLIRDQHKLAQDKSKRR